MCTSAWKCLTNACSIEVDIGSGTSLMVRTRTARRPGAQTLEEERTGRRAAGPARSRSGAPRDKESAVAVEPFERGRDLRHDRRIAVAPVARVAHQAAHVLLAAEAAAAAPQQTRLAGCRHAAERHHD